MRYSLHEGPGSEHFHVDPETGAVRVASSGLSYVPASELPFELVVAARDRPGASGGFHSTRAVVVVRCFCNVYT